MTQDYEEENEDDEEPLKPLGNNERQPQQEDFSTRIVDPWAEAFPVVKAPINSVMKADLERWGEPHKGLRKAEELRPVWLRAKRARLAEEAGSELPDEDETDGNAEGEGDEREVGTNVDIEPTSKVGKATKASKTMDPQPKNGRAEKEAEKTDQGNKRRSLIIKLRLDPKKLPSLPPESEVTTVHTRSKARANATPPPGAGSRRSPRAKKTQDLGPRTTASSASTHAKVNPAEQATDDDVDMEDEAEEQPPIEEAIKTARNEAVQPAKRKRNASGEQVANKRKKVAKEHEVIQQAAMSQPGTDIPMADGITNQGPVRNNDDKQALLQQLTGGKQISSIIAVREAPATAAALPSTNIIIDGSAPGANRPKAEYATKPRTVKNLRGKGMKAVTPKMLSDILEQPVHNARGESIKSSASAPPQLGGTSPQNFEILQPLAANVERVGQPGMSSATLPISLHEALSSAAENNENNDNVGHVGDVIGNTEEEEEEADASDVSEIDLDISESEEETDVTAKSKPRSDLRQAGESASRPKTTTINHQIDGYLPEMTREHIPKIKYLSLNVAERRQYDAIVRELKMEEAAERGEVWRPKAKKKPPYKYRLSS